MLAQNLFPKGIARSDIMKMRSFALIRVDDVRLFSYVGQGEGGGFTWRVKKHGHVWARLYSH